MWCFCLSWLHNSQHSSSFNLIWLKLRSINTEAAEQSYSAICPTHLIEETPEMQSEGNSAQHSEKLDTSLALSGKLSIRFVLDLHRCYSKQNLALFSQVA